MIPSSFLPKAYALPKIHKEDIPFRIIVSSINTALYSLTGYLQDIISENILLAKSKIKNSFEFHNKLTGMTIDKIEIMVSLDVISLFTNIPLDVALDGLVRRWNSIKSQPYQRINSLMRSNLSYQHFTFNGIIYKQTFDTPMSPPFSLSILICGGFGKESVKFFTISAGFLHILDMLMMFL